MKRKKYHLEKSWTKSSSPSPVALSTPDDNLAVSPHTTHISSHSLFFSHSSPTTRCARDKAERKARAESWGRTALAACEQEAVDEE